MSQSFYSIRERFETSTSQSQTITSRKFQSSTVSKSYIQATNATFPSAAAFPEKNPPPIPVINQVPSVRIVSREERSEKVNSFSELIKEQSRSLRVPPKVPEKPRKLSTDKAVKDQSLMAPSPRPTAAPKPSESERFRVQNITNYPTPSPKVHSLKSPQRSFSVNRLRQQFEQAHAEVPVASSKPVNDPPRSQMTRDRLPQINENQSAREVPLNRRHEIVFPKHFSPVIENVYSDLVYHGKQTNIHPPELLKSEDEQIYANIPSQRLEMLELTMPNLRPGLAPTIPPRVPAFENFAASERQMSGFNTLPRNFKSITLENFLEDKSPERNYPNDGLDSSYDSDFDDDDYEDFGEISTQLVHADEKILGKHFALNHLPDRIVTGLLHTSRQRFSYAEPQIRPELKVSMSFSQKSHEKTLIRNNLTSDDSVKYDKKLQNIAGELISTEKVYVENLMRDFEKFNEMFQRRDVPRGLKENQETLLGNIEEIIRFHRDTVLPMFEKNQKDLNRLFDQFSVLLDDHRFYEYVIFATNNKNSLTIVDDFQSYFQFFQVQINDPLGIQSFLLLPIQRLPKYELFLKDFKQALFEACSHSSKYSTQKSQVKALCDLEKKMKNFLSLVNEANVVCDIIGWTHLNLFNRENRFRKVLDDLFVYDYDLQQGYGGKVFIFDKFMIYTEVRGDFLIYRGCYDASRGIDLIAEEKAFKMAHRRVQVCNFHSETATHNQYCLSYIEDMIQSNRMNGYDQRGYGSNTSSGSMSTLLEEDEF